MAPREELSAYVFVVVNAQAEAEPHAMKESSAVIDTTAAFERRACLSHVVLANLEVGAWYQVPFEERTPIEMRFSRFAVPLLDGTLPASPSEKRLANKYIEMWSTADRHNAGWRVECAVLLEWALQLRDEVPPFDQMTRVDLNKQIDPTSQADQRARAKLRSREELEAMRAVTDRWWWRASQARPAYNALTKPTSTLSKKKQHLVRTTIDSPVELFGKPYERLTFVEASTAFSIALERVKAISWLLAGGQWDDVKPDASDM